MTITVPECDYDYHDYHDKDDFDDQPGKTIKTHNKLILIHQVPNDYQRYPSVIFSDLIWVT